MINTVPFRIKVIRKTTSNRPSGPRAIKLLIQPRPHDQRQKQKNYRKIQFRKVSMKTNKQDAKSRRRYTMERVALLLDATRTSELRHTTPKQTQ